jgi:GNAT superfamily N-acetyltransferase
LWIAFHSFIPGLILREVTCGAAVLAMSEMTITIRQAVSTDVETVYRMIQALGYPALNREVFTRVFNELLNHQETLIYLAETNNDRPLGLLTLSHRPQLRLTGKIVSVDELVVLEEARGKGVGRALLQAAKSFAESLQAERLELHTRRSRESYRRAFYVKNGFIEANSAVMRIDKEFPKD